MSYSMPASLPSHKFSSFTMGVRTLAGMTRSEFTFQRQVFSWKGELWIAKVALRPMPRAEAQPWMGVLAAMRGFQGTFLMGDPRRTSPLGVATGSPLVNGAHVSGAKTLSTKGWTAAVTNILKAGDLIQLGSGAATRLHQVNANANSDGSGNASLEIYPSIREALAGNEAITLNSCKSTFMLLESDPEWTVDNQRLYSIGFSAVEAI